MNEKVTVSQIKYKRRLKGTPWAFDIIAFLAQVKQTKAILSKFTY